MWERVRGDDVVRSRRREKCEYTDLKYLHTSQRSYTGSSWLSSPRIQERGVETDRFRSPHHISGTDVTQVDEI